MKNKKYYPDGTLMTENPHLRPHPAFISLLKTTYFLMDEVMSEQKVDMYDKDGNLDNERFDNISFLYHTLMRIRNAIYEVSEILSKKL